VNHIINFFTPGSKLIGLGVLIIIYFIRNYYYYIIIILLFSTLRKLSSRGLKTTIKNKLEWLRHVSVSSSTGKVSWKRTELNLWIKTLIRWNQNYFERFASTFRNLI